MFFEDLFGQDSPSAQAVAHVANKLPPQYYSGWHSLARAIFQDPLQYFPEQYAFQSVDATPISVSLYLLAVQGIGVFVVVGQLFLVVNKSFLWSVLKSVDKSVEVI